MPNGQKEDTDIESIYGHLCTIPKQDFISKFDIKESGLNDNEITEKLRTYGQNEVTQTKPKKWYHYLIKSLFTPFNSILIGIALILAYTDIYLASDPNYANIIVIFILVTVSTLLDFFSEYRSNLSAEKLKQLVSAHATVIRNGEKQKIPFKNLVVGDTVILSAGDMIPADLRIIDSKDLYVGQSSLTGESDAIKKLDTSEITNNEIDNISDLDTICFMGTNVISGSAKGIVILTGDNTYFRKSCTYINNRKTENCFSKRN